MQRNQSRSSILAEGIDLARLSLPIVISLAAATLIGVVDTLMVAPLGTLPLAAVSITASVLIIFYSALYGYVSVIGVRMAEAVGKDNDSALSNATRAGIAVSCLTGVLGAVAMLLVRPALGWLGQPEDVTQLLGGYWVSMSLLMIPFTVFYALKGLFDALDRAWLGVGLAFLAVGLNVPANYVLIHGLGDWEGLGLLGAGLASLLSQTVPLIIAFALLPKPKNAVPAQRGFRIDLSEIKVQIQEGTTIAIGYVGEGGAYAVAGLMMGWFSAQALAAHQIVSAVGGVIYMVPLGVSIAVSIRIAQAIGANKARRLQHIGIAAILLIVAWMCVVIVGILLGRAPLSTWLSDDPDVVALAISLFLVSAAMQIADGVQGTMLGASRGMTDNRVPVLITLVAYWILALPLGYMLGFVWGVGPIGVWIGYGAGLAVAAIAITLRFFAKARIISPTDPAISVG